MLLFRFRVIYVHNKRLPPTEETEMKKATWIVKAYTGYKTGWQEIKRFDNPGDADTWLCSLIREKGYIPTDFTIVKR